MVGIILNAKNYNNINIIQTYNDSIAGFVLRYIAESVSCFVLNVTESTQLKFRL